MPRGRQTTRIQDVMCRAVRICRADDNAATAAEHMWNRDVGFLPVVNDDGRVVAAVTDRDLCMAAYTQGKPLGEIPVSTAMSRTLISVRPNDPIARACQLMEAHQLRRLPVVDEDARVVGVVALSDLARCANTGIVGADEVTHVVTDITRPTVPVAAE